LNNVVYLSLSDYFKYIFPSIRKITYDDDRKKPIYEDQESGIKTIDGIISFIQNDNYYPTFINKASYLFTAISTGHYFPNGNKRLALFSFAYFAHQNGYNFRGINIYEYKKWFKKYFSGYRVTKMNFSTNVGWAIYNFNRAINIKYPEKRRSHKYNFDEIKEITEIFFNLILDKQKT